LNNNTNKNIAIIGLGEMGSRHLQALTRCCFKTTLYCIDPSIESLNRAKISLQELPNNSNIRSIFFEKSIDILPKNIDFSVIATTADIRFEVLSDLLERVHVDRLLLEKILFQNIDHLDKCKDLLNHHDTKTWVNCPRRMWPIYKDLRKFLIGANGVSYNLSGGMWGIGCNSIHMIDHFEWLTNSKILSINIDNLDPSVYDSKRTGFIEFSGCLKARYSNQNKMSLQSDINSDNKSFTINIKADDFSITIEESLGKLNIVSSKKDNKNLEEISNFNIPYQSELTHLVAHEVIFKNQSNLTPFVDSADQHKLLLSALKAHTERIFGKSLENCPIT